MSLCVPVHRKAHGLTGAPLVGHPVTWAGGTSHTSPSGPGKALTLLCPSHTLAGLPREFEAPSELMAGVLMPWAGPGAAPPTGR